jgi:hypothetical protein
LSDEGIIKILVDAVGNIYFKTTWDQEDSFFTWISKKKEYHPLIAKYFITYEDVWFIRVEPRHRNIRVWLANASIPSKSLVSFGVGEEYYYDIYNDKKNFKYNDPLAIILSRGLNQILELKAAFYEEYCKEKGVEI